MTIGALSLSVMVGVLAIFDPVQLGRQLEPCFPSDAL